MQVVFVGVFQTLFGHQELAGEPGGLSFTGQRTGGFWTKGYDGFMRLSSIYIYNIYIDSMGYKL